jgi:predicted DNA-binding transcriptional regulator AlpA
MTKDSKIPELKNLPNEGLLRIKQVLQFIPVSKSAWWAGVKAGRFPKPFKLSERTTVWKTQDIKTICRGVDRETGR